MNEVQTDEQSKTIDVELKRLEVELKKLEIEFKKLDPQFRKSEYRAKNLDLFVKGASVIAVLVGVTVTYIQYAGTANLQRRQMLDAQLRENRAASRESLKPFNEKRIALYTEASSVVSKVANPGSEEQRQQARNRFWELYWGELALVEDQSVETAMVQFAHTLEAYERQDASSDELLQKSLRVAHACRASLIESLDYPELGSLGEEKKQEQK